MNKCIYKITSPSGKIYIGQSGNIVKRFKAYNSGSCKMQNKLYNSIKKYGWNNHSTEILIDNINNDELLNSLEYYFIELYNSVDEGLNCSYTVGSFFKYKTHSEETKLKMSLKRTGVKRGKYNYTDEQRNNFSNYRKKLLAEGTIIHGRKGKIISEETRDKMRASAIARHINTKLLQSPR